MDNLNQQELEELVNEKLEDLELEEHFELTEVDFESIPEKKINNDC